MKTKTSIKSCTASISLDCAACMGLYEVVAPIGPGVKALLRVGDVVFRSPSTYTYVIGAEGREIARYDWNVSTLQGIRVRKFVPGDSFTIGFHE
jgi:hypothetical protein